MSDDNETTLIIVLMLLCCVCSASSGASAYFMPTTIETIIQSVSTALGGDGGDGGGGGGGTVTDPADDEANYSYIPALYSDSGNDYQPRYWFKNAANHKIVWEGVVIAEFVDLNYDFLNGGGDMGVSYYEKGGYAYHRGVGSGAGDGTYKILRTTPYPSKDQPDVTDVTATDTGTYIDTDTDTDTDTGGGGGGTSAQVDADASPDTDIGDYTKYKYVSINANSGAAYYWSKIGLTNTIIWNGEEIAGGASLPNNTIRYEKDGYAYHRGEYQSTYSYSILKTAVS